MKIEKNDNTYNKRYKTYKAIYVKSTGLPIYANTVSEYEKVAEIYLSASRCKKLKKEVNKNSGVVAWYRVMNGFVPLYDIRVLKDIPKRERKKFTGVRATEDNVILALCLVSNSYKESLFKHHEVNKAFNNIDCKACIKNDEENIHHCKLKCEKHDLYKQLLAKYDFERILENILGKIIYMYDILECIGYTTKTIDSTEYIQNIYISRKDSIVFTVPTRRKEGYYIDDIAETCTIVPFDFSDAMEVLKRYIKRHGY